MENNIKAVISEFNTFIDYNEREKPVLSAKREVFGKKASFSLNMLLNNKKQVSGPNYNQDQYPIIDLMFKLAILGKFYIKVNNADGKQNLLKTPNLQSYQCLNEYEKYVFLLQTYWTKYNFEEMFHGWIDESAFYSILYSIAKSETGQVIEKDNQNNSYGMYSEGAAFFYHLKFFGFGELELTEGAKGKYEDIIKKFYPNIFGIEASTFLASEALMYWNIKNVRLLLPPTKRESLAKKKENPFNVFKYIFKDKIIMKTVEATNETERIGVYNFKVILSKTVWRKIKLSHNHSLGDLHMAIQDAFIFDDDHLYAFYIDGNQRTGKPIYCEDTHDDGITAEKTRIFDLALYIGQKMLYLFDFGDEWKFDVELIEIDKEAPLPLKPMIIESKGEAPEQYGGEW